MTNWTANKINVAIQVLPEAEGKSKYQLVDAAIAFIQKSGFRYQVCPFETVVECCYSELQQLITGVHEACAAAGAERMLTNMKIQVNFKENVAIEDKMKKYT